MQPAASVFVVRHRYADSLGERGKSYSTPPAIMQVNPEKPRPLAFSSAGGSDQHALGIRGSAFSPSFPDKGGAQFQGRGVPASTPHPEGHLVAVDSGYSFSGCSSVRTECALWKRDANGLTKSPGAILDALSAAPSDGQGRSTQSIHPDHWKVHHR